MWSGICVTLAGSRYRLTASGAAAQHSAANASSVTSAADVGS